MYNCIIGQSSFEVAMGVKPRNPIVLINLALETKPSELGESLAIHLNVFHSKNPRKINLSNENYKSFVDLHRRFKKFSSVIR